MVGIKNIRDILKEVGITNIGGADITPRNWSADFEKLQNLDVTLSNVRDTLKASIEAGRITSIAGVSLTGRDWSSDFAKLQNLDITLSSFRDSLKGTAAKDFSTLEADVETVVSRLDITLSSLRDALKGAAGKDFSTLESTLASTLPRNLTQIAGTALTGRNWSNDFAKLQNLDITLSGLRDAIKGTGARDFTTLETDVESILSKLDITLSGLRDAIRGTGARDFTTLETDIEGILSKLDITISALRDAIRGAEGKDFTTLEKTLTNIPVTVRPSTVTTTNGDTTASPIDTSRASVIAFFLDVTAVSGTSPTLDVYVSIQDPVSGKWVDQDKFPQVTATGTWALIVPCRAVKYAVRWVLGGTNPSFTFSVGAVLIAK